MSNENTSKQSMQAEATDWSSLVDQQIWFDKFKSPISEDSFGLKFNQFQEFLSATIYTYFASQAQPAVIISSSSEVANPSIAAIEPGQRRNKTNKYQGELYRFAYQQELQLFKSFDINNDHVLDRDEFSEMCQSWLDKTYHRRSALVVVDVQNDFIDGSLALINGPAGQDGVEVVPVINEILNNCHFDLVVYTQDWHPIDHIGFHENLHMRKFILKEQKISDNNNKNLDDGGLQANSKYRYKFKKLVAKANVFDTVLFDEGKMEQKLWPKHCVQNSWGAELHPNLKVIPNSIRIHKGTLSHVDAYSAFWDNMRLNETGLRQELLSRKISEVFFCGLALDYCVSASALDSSKAGFMTLVIEDACRGIDLEEIKRRKKELMDNGVLIIKGASLIQVHNKGSDNRPVSSPSSSSDSWLSLIKIICFKRAVDRFRWTS